MDHTERRIPVLIETLWNVKDISAGINRLVSSRINRNIVECKGRSKTQEGSPSKY